MAPRIALAVASALAVATPLVGQERALAPLEVRPSPAFQEAVESETRTSTGVPGPAYWQQAVAYDIEVAVDPATRLLTGSQTIRYTNHSPDTLGDVVLNLYQNLFAEGAIRTRYVPITGGLAIDRLAVDGVDRRIDPDDTSETVVRGTKMMVELPAPLPPGGTTTLAIDWRFTIPAGDAVPRMGMADETTGLIAQWYPQIATYDDLAGWDLRPYLGNGEFYLEYGTFDLAITVPAGTVVAATGVLTNPEEVLPNEIRRQLALASTSDASVPIVTEADFGPGRATLGEPGQTLTWRFHAEDVRDAAFAFSDHYLWDASSGVVDEATGRRTLVHALYRPSAATWTESARMTKDAIETFSRNVVPYRYPQITSVEGLVGGMEYPMIVFVRDYDAERRTQRVIAHEVGHEWFPMMVGSDETGYAWMDEGVNTFITIFAAEHYYPDSSEREEVRERYRDYARETSVELHAMMRPDAIDAGGGEVGVLGYRHPATALLALREILGSSTFDRALTTYAERWLFKRPAPWDFFATFEDVAGRELDWFWVPWFYGPGASDLAIAGVATSPAGDGRTRVDVSVRNDGSVLVPVRLRITTAVGEAKDVEAPASVWFDGARSTTVTATIDGEVARIELDPDGVFADIDPGDDVWTPEDEVGR